VTEDGGIARPRLSSRGFFFDHIVKKITKWAAAMDFTLPTYYPIYIYFVVVVAFAGATVVMAHLVGPVRKTPVKLMPYESGMDPIGDARQRFDVKFYLIAILFLVIDVELLFLYPWAALYPETGDILPGELRTVVFWEVLVFLATVVVAYVYAWRRGVFQWR
jgi:NADH-quinone oxidoreductase subunit A